MVFTGALKLPLGLNVVGSAAETIPVGLSQLLFCGRMHTNGAN
jgi:hypothetical protein